MTPLTPSGPLASPVRIAPSVLSLAALLAIVAVGTSLAAGASETCPLHERHTAALAGDGEIATAPAQADMAALATSPGDAPMETGEAAFAALSEMARRLEADPSVDWSRVRLDRLREHLVDMHRVSTEAAVVVTDLEDGFRARVTSDDPRTSAAISRMLPAHGRMMQGHRGWRVEVAELADADGVTVSVRAADPSEAERLRGLGFTGFLVSGDHHRPHHQAMVLGRHP